MANLNRQSFVLTGLMNKARKIIVADIESHNGAYHKYIKSNTDYLVTNSATITNKRRKAESKGIIIITEEDLYRLIDGIIVRSNSEESNSIRSNQIVDDSDTIGDVRIIYVED